MAFALNHKIAKILGMISGSQTHVYHSQDAQEIIHRLVQCCLLIDNDQDKDVGAES